VCTGGIACKNLYMPSTLISGSWGNIFSTNPVQATYIIKVANKVTLSTPYQSTSQTTTSAGAMIYNTSIASGYRPSAQIFRTIYCNIGGTPTICCMSITDGQLTITSSTNGNIPTATLVYIFPFSIDYYV